MTKEEVVALLDGNEYGSEGSPELFAQMKADRLICLFGYSDDNIEIRGAADDEVGAYGGTQLRFTSRGLLVNQCEDERCPYHLDEARGAALVRVSHHANATEGMFGYDTAIPHARFKIMEDGDLYSWGIVFSLDELTA